MAGEPRTCLGRHGDRIRDLDEYLESMKRFGAERLAHADLAGALLHRVCDCAIYPNCCE